MTPCPRVQRILPAVSVDRQPEKAEPKLTTAQPVDLAALYQRHHDRLRRHAECVPCRAACSTRSTGPS